MAQKSGHSLRPKEARFSSTGLQENVGGLLAYSLVFISGFVLLMVEKENDYIRFHAMQAIVVFASFFVFGMTVNLIPIIGPMIALFTVPVALSLWVLLMIKAYKGERFHLSGLGKVAEFQLKQMK
ncbi:DUF4870 domain-containing protein [Halobacillus yeomjeoni]|uniref:DUF4870 domain-containing protein n=1 Tax=Halobacillus yeomjeoni TaxID=311194 RepID=A0A931HXH8_9BACI|nr:hypothetical protein [Halobacillus yeomjeoni]MBH0231293.1 hypothetical protein [Halobacillus yeomjeoni]